MAATRKPDCPIAADLHSADFRCQPKKQKLEETEQQQQQQSLSNHNVLLTSSDESETTGRPADRL